MHATIAFWAVGLTECLYNMLYLCELQCCLVSITMNLTIAC